MKQPIEVLFETCANSLGRPVPPRTLQEFQEQCGKDRIMREGVRTVCEAMEKYATQRTQELNLMISALRERVAELEKDTVIVE